MILLNPKEHRNRNKECVSYQEGSQNSGNKTCHRDTTDLKIDNKKDLPMVATSKLMRIY